jgi:hypothetical protein
VACRARAQPVRPDSSWALTRTDPMAQNPHAECIKSPTSLLNPTSPAPALCSPSSHAALHHLHSPPRHVAAPNCVMPALHSPPCHAAAPLSPLPIVSRRCSPLHRACTPLPTAPHHRSTVSTPHHTAQPLHHLHSPTGLIHHGRF